MLKIMLYIKEGTISFENNTVCHTHTSRKLLGRDIDMVFCYQIALWVTGECEIVGRTLSLSVQHC